MADLPYTNHGVKIGVVPQINITIAADIDADGDTLASASAPIILNPFVALDVGTKQARTFNGCSKNSTYFSNVTSDLRLDIVFGGMNLEATFTDWKVTFVLMDPFNMANFPLTAPYPLTCQCTVCAGCVASE